MNKLTETKVLSLKDVVESLKSLTRYEAKMAGNCECCGSWIEHDEDAYGDWIKVIDIKNLIKQLEKK